MNGGTPMPVEGGIRLIKPVGTEPMLVPQVRPTPGPGEALLRVITVGLCRTDLLIADGRIGAPDGVTLGHEFSGVLEAVSGPCPIPLGTLVSVDPTFEREDGSDGFMGREIDGALATWAVVPVDKIFAADGLTAAEAAYLEPVAAAMGGLGPVRKRGGFGLVVGENRIATLTAEVLRSFGVAFDQLSHERFRDQTLDDAGLARYDWIIETKLEDDLFSIAAEALRAHGALILKSRHRVEATFPAARWAEKQLSIIGRSRSDFPSAMAWLKANRAVVAPLLGDTFLMEEWPSAFAVANGGDQGKTFILVPGSEHAADGVADNA